MLVPSGDFSDGDSASGSITLGLGASEENAYFLKIISAASGGSIINYSDRFSISGMTGVFPPNVEAGVKSVDGTDGPATQNEIESNQNPAAGGAPAAAGGEYTVPYTMQTDPTRYAPMPPMAVTRITAKNNSPQWPTSAFTVATAPLGSPNAVTTMTAPLTFSASSIENTVHLSYSAVGEYTILTKQRSRQLGSLRIRLWPNFSIGGKTEPEGTLASFLELVEL